MHIRNALEPMLATIVDRLPAAATGGRAGLRYEPKWDGFRCIARVDEGGKVELNSRRLRSMNQPFPDIARAVADAIPPETVVDGELVCWVDGRLDFGTLQLRNAAGRRAGQVAQEFPCHYIVFDVLEREGRDLRDRKLAERREELEDLFATRVPKGSPLTLGMHTADRALAEQWFDQLSQVGVEGLVVKQGGEKYSSGQRGWHKVKAYATTEVLIGGVTGTVERPTELILGRYVTDGTGELRVVARTVPLSDHHAAEVAKVITPTDDHPWPELLEAFWMGGKGPTEYHRVEPTVVAEIRIDPATQAGRWRHGSRLIRLRPDVDPDQIPRDLDLEA